MNPKIPIVKLKARLSWQYHKRRAEIWQVFKGSAGIIRSDTNIENEMEVYNEGDQIILKQVERHRLIGLDDYSVVAAIWNIRMQIIRQVKMILFEYKAILEDKKEKYE